MRAKPTYTWEWFESHTPFKNILEKMCDLKIEHEAQKIPTIAGCWTTNHHYIITYNKKLFEDNFETIKQALLKTNICKYNKDVYEFVNEKTFSNRTISDLVIQDCGCYKYHSGSFEWHDVSKD